MSRARSRLLLLVYMLLPCSAHPTAATIATADRATISIPNSAIKVISLAVSNQSDDDQVKAAMKILEAIFMNYEVPKYKEERT